MDKILVVFEELETFLEAMSLQKRENGINGLLNQAAASKCDRQLCCWLPVQEKPLSSESAAKGKTPLIFCRLFKFHFFFSGWRTQEKKIPSLIRE